MLENGQSIDFALELQKAEQAIFDELSFPGKKLFGPLLRWLLKAKLLQRSCYNARNLTDVTAYTQALLDEIKIKVAISDNDLAKIPPTGSLIIIANHAYGIVDGCAFLANIVKVRPDLKILTNPIFVRFMSPHVHKYFIKIAPFGTATAQKNNRQNLQHFIQWIKEGHAIALFPAGEVAHFNWRTRRISESPWQTSFIKLIHSTQATVLPIYFTGGNNWWFNLIGLIHPLLRSATIIRQTYNKKNLNLKVNIGWPIPFTELATLPKTSQAEYLLQRTLSLAFRERTSKLSPVITKNHKQPAAIAPPAAKELLSQDITLLPKDALLAISGNYHVYQATSQNLPNILMEIGRLREISYRQEGEGTGKPIDLDQFDNHYHHLFVWDDEIKEVVGAYRFAWTDKILKERGISGLYLSDLFAIKTDFFNSLNPAIEFGRSFVRVEHQRSYLGLKLLWQGIFKLCKTNPQYRYVYGLSSISRKYHPIMLTLIVAYLHKETTISPLAKFIQPKYPYMVPKKYQELYNLGTKIPDLNSLQKLITDLIPDSSQVIPILFRRYLKLEAQFITCGTDPDFANCLDCLLINDMYSPACQWGMRKYAS